MTSPESQSPSARREPVHSIPAHLASLIRHFNDLRDGVHGFAASRRDRETHFAHEVDLLSPVARQVLSEVNTHLLLDSGALIETGLQRSADGGLSAAWEVGWPQQREAGVAPIMLYAYFGSRFHHPHLRGRTARDWPLNVYNVREATDQLPILRAIATCDVHNLVFQADYQIIPVVMKAPAS